MSMPNPNAVNLSCEQSLTAAPLIVLDTNAVLDWLLFRDPSMAPIAAAIASGPVRWIATAAMREEFAHVLGRGLAARRSLDAAGWESAWVNHCTFRESAPPASPGLCCTDPDDQKFVDLALAAGARWLVSRDRAVLKLHRRAAAKGLAIVPPDRWRLE
jgi:predicted nucleic acid-binding protein